MTVNALVPFVGISLCLVACASESADPIIDIGKSCSAASECEHVCTRESGAATGRCSVECASESDCPSFMDCVTSSSTGERRCFAIGGIVTGPVVGFCQGRCRDVDFFCTGSSITEAETAQCIDWCRNASDLEGQAFIDCVDAEPRYQSSCPAAECVLERIP